MNDNEKPFAMNYCFRSDQQYTYNVSLFINTAQCDTWQTHYVRLVQRTMFHQSSHFQTYVLGIWILIRDLLRGM